VSENEAQAAGRRRVLNVGGHSRDIPIPAHYAGWDNLLLDIDPKNGPDYVCDARELQTLAPGIVDAVYCAHNLEHYLHHEAARVLAGFRHVMKADAFCEIVVPDIGEVIRRMVARGLDLDDVLYESPAGPIMVRDVLWGYGVEIERSGNDFFAHKTGFTQASLLKILMQAGFAPVYIGSAEMEVRAIAFNAPPTPFHLRLLGIAPPPAR